MTFPTVALPNQYANGFTDEDDLHLRFDVPAEAMAEEMRTWGHDFPYFAGQRGAGLVAVGTNLAFTPQIDSVNGWNGATNAYTIPTRGLYVISSTLVQSSSVSFTLSVFGVPAGYFQPLSRPAEAATGRGASLAGQPVPLSAGSQISVRVQGSAPTLAAADINSRNVLLIAMVAHR